ncbi:MAG: GIY-YIG nuclease family protein [Patescibacteria group bacterium]
MTYYVYVLRSLSTTNRYIGQTNNLTYRLAKHNSGRSKYTKNRGPWELIYSEKYSLRTEAMRREKFLKSGVGREFLDSLSE